MLTPCNLLPPAGLLVVRGALEPELQCQLVVAALTRFNEPPNHTTHTRAHPAGLPGLWAAAQQGLRLRQPQGQQEPAGAPPPPSSELWVEGGAGPTAASLLRRLRWATLGPPYDWTQRAYLRDAPHTPLPEQLRQLAVTLADLAHRLLPGSGDSNGGGAADADGPPAGASGQQQPAAYCPDAALVNFYYEGTRWGRVLGRTQRRRPVCNSARLLAAPHQHALPPCLPSPPPQATRSTATWTTRSAAWPSRWSACRWVAPPSS